MWKIFTFDLGTKQLFTANKQTLSDDETELVVAKSRLEMPRVTTIDSIVNSRNTPSEM